MTSSDLSREAQTFHRAVRLIPGPTWTAEAAAATADLPSSEVEGMLRELVDARLLTCPTPGRYAHADTSRSDIRRQRAQPTADRDQALTRALEYYLGAAASADRVLNPGKWHLAPVFDRTPSKEFASRALALEWLEDELGNLRACVRVAHDTGRHALVWQFCEALRNLFMLRKHFQIWEDTHTLGLASAEAIDNNAAQALVLGGLGALRLTRGDADRALELHTTSLGLWERARHRLGQAAALEAAGVCELARNRPGRAQALFAHAYEIHELLNRPRGKALLTRRLGEAARDLGEHEDALGHLTEALGFFTEAEEPYMRARTLAGVATTHLAAGDPGRAGEAAVQAHQISARIGAVAEEAGALVLLADVAHLQGRPRDERGLLSRALELYTRLGSVEAVKVRARLAGGGPDASG
ncbi:tetratricopeptide repeat protein [Nocardiopsis exhalans]|uniref:Tetratricopeptide repeat protein n=1 Tax=Nocardiopsis exhalans TaxID=163604 RepID=A0ABY5DF91_9ACTN|nr:tetratricopeptide repeat protein [Nocardiopsis exhalans]USY21733.1 tetratricopeptide repeat protein [Nocardiopsis exhalans]